MFRRWGRWTYASRWWVIAAWSLVLAISLLLVPRVPSALQLGGFDDPSLESSRALQLLHDRLGYHANNFQIIFHSATWKADDPRFIDAVHTALAPVAALPGVADIRYHPNNPAQVARDGYGAYEQVDLTRHADTSPAAVRRLKAAIRPTPLTVLVAGAPVFGADIERLSSQDLRRAETIAFPFAIVVLVLVFGSLVAAGVPAAVGGASVAVSLALIFGIAHLTAMSIFVLNVATMIGLGLGVDYSLFLTSRFREEMVIRPVPDAIAETVATAGHAVFFSGLTVCLGLLALISFRFTLLRSVGIGGSLVVAMSVLAALTLLPAILAVLGPRIDAWRLLPKPRGVGRIDRFWGSLAEVVMRRPIAVALPVLAFLLLLGTPFFHVQLSSVDASILPKHVESRRAYDVLQQQFGANQTTPMLVVVQLDRPAIDPSSLRLLYDFTHRLQADPRVRAVTSLTTIDPRLTLAQYELTYIGPNAIADAYARAAAQRLGAGTTTLVAVTTAASPSTPQAQALVRDTRTLARRLGLHVLVGGTAAAIADIDGELYGQFPHVLLFILASTYVVLLLLLRSVVLPLKALVMNTLSILGAYGALVFVFQDGHLSGLLHFTPLGYVESELPILMFCTLFGLSMDYEVFLLTRMQEAYRATGDNRASVALGLQRSGRIITSAATIVVLVAGSFVMADIVLIKALGLGVAIAVFLDATVVRALLVPATMRLLGDLNWWAPRWLQQRPTLPAGEAPGWCDDQASPAQQPVTRP